MPVFRVNKNSNYTVMSNSHLRDIRLSLKAKGLLSEMLSLPNDWNYSIAGLVAINKEEETAIKSALSELKDCGYVKITRFKPDETDSGKIEWVYDIFESPNQHTENQPIENQPIEVLSVENQAQLNTKELTTKDKKKNNKQVKQAEIDSMFERVWKLYPKKEGKHRVTKQAKVALYKAGEDKIIRAVENYKAKIEREHKEYQYIKQGSTFFNGDWQDFVGEPEQEIPEGYVLDKYGELMKMPIGRLLTPEECERLGRDY